MSAAAEAPDVVRSGPTTFVLLLVAFATLQGVLGLTGFALYWEARRVHAETRDIVDNALPGVVHANVMKEIVRRLRQAERLYGLRLELGARRFRDAAASFEPLLAEEERGVLFFPGERAALAEVRARFGRILAEESLVRMAYLGGAPPKGLSHEQRFRLDVGALEQACARLARANEDGMQGARDLLATSSREEERVLALGLAGAAAIALAWAVALALGLARPLEQLRRSLRALPEEGGVAVAARWPPWTPSEVRALGRTLEETDALLRRASAQRELARQALEASFVREGDLNRELARANASLDSQVRAKTAALEEANRRLASLVEALRERDRSKSAFLASVSHELRTPLAVIKGAALTMLGLRLQLAEAPAERLLRSVAAESEHLSALVEDLLDVARMDAGTFRIERSAGVDLGALAASVVSGMGSLFEEQELRFRAELPPDLPPLVADAERLRQILRNLLENAAKFSQPGGEVALAIRREGGPEGETLLVSVEDRGPGVPAELKERLFTPFTQGRRSKGGAGLGLAISRQLVEAHGGRIGLEDRPGGGSRFWVSLPLTPDSA